MATKATITKTVGVYASASTTSTKKTTYKKGDKVTVNNLKNDTKGNCWAKSSKGWFMTYRKSDKTKFCTLKMTTLSGTTTKVDVREGTAVYNSFVKSLTDSLKESTNGYFQKTMQLFGIPYQFLPSVDYRLEEVSSIIGRKFIENIMLDAPVVTIMPGKPAFLPSVKKNDKVSISNAFIQATSGNMGALKAISQSMNVDDLKFYDFKTDYIRYFSYVNVMCRTCAAFLELQSNSRNYKINGQVVNFMNYDWKNYRWDGKGYSSSVNKVINAGKNAVGSAFEAFQNFGKSVISYFTNSDADSEYTKVKNEKGKSKKYDIGDETLNLNDGASKISEEDSSTAESLLRNTHYIQFYCDPSSGVNETIENATKTSSLKGLFEQGSDVGKEFAFITNSGGVDTANIEKLGDSAIDAISGLLGGVAGSFNDSAGTLISRLFSTGKNVLKGDSIVMPDIYSNSTYSKSYQLTFNFKAIYGNKTSLYMDVLVPCCHVLGLVLPKATTANTFSAPMLVKVFMPGKFTCNMGIITGCSFDRKDESRNVDGLPTEVTVTLSITDLYSDLMMTPASDPILFCNNSSLVEYLAINCGLDLVNNQFATKFTMMLNNISNFPKEVVTNNVFAKLEENLNDMLSKFGNISFKK